MWCWSVWKEARALCGCFMEQVRSPEARKGKPGQVWGNRASFLMKLDLTL